MISITLPSLYPHKLERALENLRETTRGVYEVIVVSPFEPKRRPRDEIVWLRETANKGANNAHARAALIAHGDFLLAWVDDHLLAPGWDDAAVAELHALQIVNRRSVLGLRHADVKHVGTVFGHYYPYFPFTTRDLVGAFGWFDGAFRRGFADCDLGLRFWNCGGYCSWSGPLVTRCEDDHKNLPDDEAGYEREDLELFLARWRSRFGDAWYTHTIRDFNVDVVPEDIPRAVKDGTLRCANLGELYA